MRVQREGKVVSGRDWCEGSCVRAAALGRGTGGGGGGDGVWIAAETSGAKFNGQES